MNKKLLSFFLLIILFLAALNYSKEVQQPFISVLETIKIGYFNVVESFDSFVQRHISQANTIQRQEAELKEFRKNYLVVRQLASEVEDLLELEHSSLKVSPKVELVRAISYEKFGNMNRLWLEFPDFNSSRIYGLTYKNMVAGIVVNKKNRALALLNRDLKSSYAVLVGDEKAPGIVHGNNGKDLVVTFIPAWFKIKKGDEIVTSGLDNLFFKGLKVGKVVSISFSQGYQKAKVKPYFQSQNLDYFHVITKVR